MLVKTTKDNLARKKMHGKRQRAAKKNVQHMKEEEDDEWTGSLCCEEIRNIMLSKLIGQWLIQWLIYY